MRWLGIKTWHVVAVLTVVGVGIILLGEPWNHASEVCINLGTGLLGSVLIFVVLDTYLNYIRKANGMEVEGFDYASYIRNIEKATRKARILGTFIYPLTNDERYQGLKGQFLTALENALKARPNLIVQFLFLDPASLAARQRAAERKDDRVIQRIEETLAELRRLQDSPSPDNVFKRIEVRLYNRSPAIAFFQLDNWASMSFYLRNRKASDVNRFVFFTDTPLGVYIEHTFEDFWYDAETRSLKDYTDPVWDMSNGRHGTAALGERPGLPLQ